MCFNGEVVNADRVKSGSGACNLLYIVHLYNT